MPAIRPLSASEARVLGTLIEKARTVPDSYPLTLNSLVLGCNQKTSREPLMNLSEREVVLALEELRELGLALEVHGARVPRFEHNMQRGLPVPEQSAVLLGLLLLRGPQTAGELRLNAERWYRFADISSVEGFLEELQERSIEKGGPLVLCLPRAPGAREPRWVHLLCGPVDAADFTSGAHSPPEPGVSARVQALEQEVARLRQTRDFVVQELGLTLPPNAE